MEALLNSFRKHKDRILTGVIILLCIAICIEIIRDLSRAGDFKGYVDAGLLAWKRQDIYSDVYNTWPPFFSIFSIPLAWLDGLSPVLNRFIWLCLTMVAFVASINLSTQILFQKKLSFRKSESFISLKNILVLIPILLVFRYLLDNLSNIQINIFLLYGCLLSYHLFTKSKPIGAALVLAFIISLKVIPIFILFYFIYRKKWMVSFWTLLFILVFNSISLLYFGLEEGLAHYQSWIQNVAPKSYVAHRNNQSVVGGLLRLLTNEDTSIPFSINFLNLSKESVIRLSYFIMTIMALIPIYLFRSNKEASKTSVLSILEFSFVLTAIPILSPLSWKAYFIFLWFPYFLLYYLIYNSNYVLSQAKILKRAFLVSVLFTTFSSEMFIGRYIGYRLEVCSVITIGTIILLIVQLLIYRDLKKIKYKKSTF